MARVAHFHALPSPLNHSSEWLVSNHLTENYSKPTNSSAFLASFSSIQVCLHCSEWWQHWWRLRGTVSSKSVVDNQSSRENDQRLKICLFALRFDWNGFAIHQAKTDLTIAPSPAHHTRPILSSSFHSACAQVCQRTRPLACLYRTSVWPWLFFRFRKHNTFTAIIRFWSPPLRQRSFVRSFVSQRLPKCHLSVASCKQHRCCPHNRRRRLQPHPFVVCFEFVFYSFFGPLVSSNLVVCCTWISECRLSFSLSLSSPLSTIPHCRYHLFCSNCSHQLRRRLPFFTRASPFFWSPPPSRCGLFLSAALHS